MFRVTFFSLRRWLKAIPPTFISKTLTTFPFLIFTFSRVFTHFQRAHTVRVTRLYYYYVQRVCRYAHEGVFGHHAPRSRGPTATTFCQGLGSENSFVLNILTRETRRVLSRGRSAKPRSITIRYFIYSFNLFCFFFCFVFSTIILTKLKRFFPREMVYRCLRALRVENYEWTYITLVFMIYI